MGPRLSPPADVLTNRADRTFTVKARLKPGVSINSAAAEISALAKSFEQSYPDTNRGFGATVHTEVQARLDVTPFYQSVLVLLFGLVTVVLLIACANVANLTLGRGRSRSRELAVRLAIGASRFRLVRQLMMENLLIALAGGGLGLLIAQAMVEVLSNLEIVGDLPIKASFRLDGRVLAFTLFVSIASAILLVFFRRCNPQRRISRRH